MPEQRRHHLKLDEPALVFGGPYSNLQATKAVFAEANRRGIMASHIICTGDLVAYCGSPVQTLDLVRGSGIHVVMGNCDEQLADGAGDCGCGFPAGGSCERLSAAWYAYADGQVDLDQRQWLAKLPRRIDLSIANRTLAIIHGSVSQINQFVFASTPEDVKRSRDRAVRLRWRYRGTLRRAVHAVRCDKRGCLPTTPWRSRPACGQAVTCCLRVNGLSRAPSFARVTRIAHGGTLPRFLSAPNNRSTERTGGAWRHPAPRPKCGA